MSGYPRKPPPFVSPVPAAPPADSVAPRLSLSPDRREPSTVVLGLTVLGLVLLFWISPPFLTVLGVPYDAPYGAFPFKLHPSTYVLSIAFALSLVQQGNPLAQLGRSLAHRPAVAAFLAVVVAMIAYSVLRYGFSGAAFFIDSHVVPALLALLLSRFDVEALRRLSVLVIGMIAFNGMIGVVEQLLQARLIPHTVAGGFVLIEDTFRSTALMGHPLNNAAITGFAMVVCFGIPKPALRYGLSFFLLVALMCFGGRAALGTFGGLLLMLICLDALRALWARQVSYRTSLGAVLAGVAALGLLVVAVVYGGVGERIIEKLAWDDSASVRQTSLQVYGLMDAHQLLFGVTPDEIAVLIQRLGLSAIVPTIENFWIVLSLQLGVPLTVLFGLALFVFLGSLGAANGWAARAALFGFVVVASTSNSLSAKTVVLSAVVAIALTSAAWRVPSRSPAPAQAAPSFPPPRSASASRSAPAASRPRTARSIRPA